MEAKLAVIRGDGIGPDIVEQALLVLHKIEGKFGHSFHCQDVLAGGCAIDAVGNCLPQETIDVCKAADAVLLGAVGGPKWDTLPGGSARSVPSWACARSWASSPTSAPP